VAATAPANGEGTRGLLSPSLLDAGVSYPYLCLVASGTPTVGDGAAAAAWRDLAWAVRVVQARIRVAHREFGLRPARLKQIVELNRFAVGAGRVCIAGAGVDLFASLTTYHHLPPVKSGFAGSADFADLRPGRGCGIFPRSRLSQNF